MILCPELFRLKLSLFSLSRANASRFAYQLYIVIIVVTLLLEVLDQYWCLASLINSGALNCP